MLCFYIFHDLVTGSGSTSLEASKALHMRHLVVQYLTCKDVVVRGHMENALITLLRLNPQEKALIAEKKQREEQNKDSFFSFFGSLSSTGS